MNFRLATGRRALSASAVLAGCLFFVFGAQASSIAATPNGYWLVGAEAAMPGNAAVAASQVVSINDISCSSAGNCTAVGSYTDNSGHREGLMLTETSGAWATGVEATLPGDAAAIPSASVTAVSCTSPGNCSAVGTYANVSPNYGTSAALLLTETDGTWAAGVSSSLPADAMTGSQGNQSGDLVSISCVSAGNCTAVGTYRLNDHLGDSAGLLVTQSGGTWSNGLEAPLPGNATAGHATLVNSVSCVSAGNCVAVGAYNDRARALLLTQINGSWGAAEASGPMGSILVSVACPSAGNCTAVGSVSDFAALVVDETDGTWGSGTEATLPANAQPNAFVDLLSVSCGSAGNCSAVGNYRDNGGFEAEQALLLSETNGSWGAGVEAALPANAGSGQGAYASLNSISCPTAGNCSALGGYLSTGAGAGLLVTETAGTWATGTEVSQPAKDFGAQFRSISCTAPETCGGAGSSGPNSPGAGLLLAGTSTAPTEELTVSKSGTGSGSVASAPAGIDCGSTCAKSFVIGSEVTLTATPSVGSYFNGWGGQYGCYGEIAPLQVSMDSDETAAPACFDLHSYTVTVHTAGRGSGTVMSSTGGISCRPDCHANINYGTRVKLIATPHTRSAFAGWSGGGCSGSHTCRLTVTGDATVTAHFAHLHCLVPAVKGEPLTAAKHAIVAGHCAVGRITRSASANRPKGTVISQSPAAGTHAKFASKVTLVVSRGRS